MQIFIGVICMKGDDPYTLQDFREDMGLLGSKRRPMSSQPVFKEPEDCKQEEKKQEEETPSKVPRPYGREDLGML